MTKVSELKYQRYTVEDAKRAFAIFKEAAERATSADDVLAAREALLTEIRHYSTATALANCRFTLNTRDEFYQGEVDYYDEVGPEISTLMTEFAAIMLDSPYRSELEARLNPQTYKMYEVQRKAFSPLIVEDAKKENALVTEYSKFMSEMEFEYNGRKLPLSSLRGYLTNTDRQVRRAACEAIGKGLGKNAEELDRIFDELVKVRTQMARKMGYADFVELGYHRMGRTGYDRKMVEKFRDNVKKTLVPVISELKEKIRVRLGWEKVMFYDDDVYLEGEAPDPIVDTEGIFKAAAEMYDEMSEITGSFMHEMLDAEAFDVESRDGKWGGGFCTAFPDYKQSFILANFNGTAADLDVITHEFGHALASDFVFKEGDPELEIGGMETAECHSMSMEFLTWPYMEKFFGSRADNYRLKHMLDALSFIPYGVIVDEFQHEVYSHPEYTPAERKALYRSLEEKYRPYISYDSLPYLEEGTRWQYQMHIYETPFYYIDYCLAGTVAFGFLVKSREDYKAAFNDYIAFVRKGGTEPFEKLVSDAGIMSPFKDGALDKVAESALKIEKELTEKLQA